MSDPRATEPGLGGENREEALSMLFAQMVMQQANMATMLLGKTPHPHSGETMHDLEGARMFIDQLEMLEAKTKGNLNKQEQALLQQSLMSLRLAFVEAVSSPAGAPKPSDSPAAAAADSGAQAGDASAKSATEGSAVSEEESKKKFSKKY